MASSIRDPEMQRGDCLAIGNLSGTSCEYCASVRPNPIESFQSVHLVIVIVVIGFVKPPRQHIDCENFSTSVL
jgi:hypothetical protein